MTLLHDRVFPEGFVYKDELLSSEQERLWSDLHSFISGNSSLVLSLFACRRDPHKRSIIVDRMVLPAS